MDGFSSKNSQHEEILLCHAFTADGSLLMAGTYINYRHNEQCMTTPNFREMTICVTASVYFLSGCFQICSGRKKML